MTHTAKESLATISKEVEGRKIENVALAEAKKTFMESLKRGLRFLWKDMTKKHLLWVKIIFFLQSASLVTLYPYLVSFLLLQISL
jgi:hypothetical protein